MLRLHGDWRWRRQERVLNVSTNFVVRVDKELLLVLYQFRAGGPDRAARLHHEHAQAGEGSGRGRQEEEQEQGGVRLGPEL